MKRFGNDAEGVIGVPFSIDGGHTFSFKIASGVTSFYDCQNGFDDSSTMFDNIFSNVDSNGLMTVARLDNAEPIPEMLAKYISLEN